MRTSFLCFFVSGFPSVPSSGGGIGGAGAEVEAAFSALSTSGSRSLGCDPSNEKYIEGGIPGLRRGSGLKTLWLKC